MKPIFFLSIVVACLLTSTYSCKKNTSENPLPPGSEDTTTVTDTTDAHLNFLIADGGAYASNGRAGKIVKVKGNGTGYTILDTFTSATGYGMYASEDFCNAGNGKYYAITIFGGAANAGTAVYFDTTDNAIKKIKDNPLSLTGLGGFTKAIDNNLYIYGPFTGGSPSQGMLQINTSTNVNALPWTGDGIQYGSLSNTLVTNNDNALYGVFNLGYSASTGFNSGYFYKYEPLTASLTRLAAINDAYGKTIYGKLLKGSDGYFYGLAERGGTKNMGTIFRYNSTTSQYATVVEFDSTNGKYPPSGGCLVAGNNGKLYGYTQNGGTDNRGLIFSYDISSNVYTVEASFASTNGSPWGRFWKSPGGNFYFINSTTLCRFNPVTKKIKSIKDLHVDLIRDLGPFYIMDIY